MQLMLENNHHLVTGKLHRTGCTVYWGTLIELYVSCLRVGHHTNYPVAMVAAELILGVSALLLGLALYLYHAYSYFSSRNIPHKRPIPPFGNLAAVALKRVSFADRIVYLYNEFPGQRLAGVYEFLNPIVMIRDPDLIKQITVKDFDHFTDHRQIMSVPGKLFSKNIFALRGKQWKDMRSIMSPAFTSSKMRAMFVLVAEIGDQLANYLDSEIDKQGGGVLTMDMKDLFTRYATDVVATSAFGAQCDSMKDKNNEFYRIGYDLSNMSGIKAIIMLGYMMVPGLMKLLGISFVSKKATNFLINLVKDTVAIREREGIVRPDIIHLLMQARKGELTEEYGDSTSSAVRTHMTDSDIAAQGFGFFLAGFDTISTVLCFAAHQVAMDPQVQERLQDEIDAVLKQHDGKVTYEAVQSMKYLDMVVEETLRLYPPVAALDRLCVKSYTIPASDDSPAVTLRPGDSVWIPVFGIHRDPDYYPDPERFDPERFSDENKDNLRSGTQLVFGTGPRSCMGNRFALMEAKVALINVLCRFDLTVVPKTPNPIKLTPKSFNLTAEGGFWLGIRRRVKQRT